MPRWVRVRARLVAQVVLPSPGSALVTTRTLTDRSVRENTMLVCRVAYASAAARPGTDIATRRMGRRSSGFEGAGAGSSTSGSSSRTTSKKVYRARGPVLGGGGGAGGAGGSAGAEVRHGVT